MTRTSLLRLAAAAALLCLAGCARDYALHSDRIAYSMGDSVKANMAIQTINPSKGSMYKTGGLGKNGNVIAPAGTTPSP